MTKLHVKTIVCVETTRRSAIQISNPDQRLRTALPRGEISIVLVQSNVRKYSYRLQRDSEFSAIGLCLACNLGLLEMRSLGLVQCWRFRFGLPQDSMINMVMTYVTHTSIRGDR